VRRHGGVWDEQTGGRQAPRGNHGRILPRKLSFNFGAGRVDSTGEPAPPPLAVKLARQFRSRMIAPPLVVHPERELPSPVYEVPPASASEIFERFRHNARVTRPANALTDRKYFRLWF
jgi:hypothetical protein